jgi:hypothetical protein
MEVFMAEPTQDQSERERWESHIRMEREAQAERGDGETGSGSDGVKEVPRPAPHGCTYPQCTCKSGCAFGVKTADTAALVKKADDLGMDLS